MTAARCKGFLIWLEAEVRHAERVKDADRKRPGDSPREDSNARYAALVEVLDEARRQFEVDA